MRDDENGAQRRELLVAPKLLGSVVVLGGGARDLDDEHRVGQGVRVFGRSGERAADHRGVGERREVRVLDQHLQVRREDRAARRQTALHQRDDLTAVMLHVNDDRGVAGNFLG